jgi:acyl carrier protein
VKKQPPLNIATGDDMDFLELFNGVARVARPVHVTHTPVTERDLDLAEYGLDSLDLLMICIYLCELYGIPEETGKDMPAETVQVIEDFIQAHKTQQPDSVAQALESIQ